MGSTLWARLLPQSWWDSLPSIPEDQDQEVKDYCVILGGLSLVLSRIPRRAAERQYPAAWELRTKLRSPRLWRKAPVELNLVSDACHEVSDIADRCTKDALLRRLRAGRDARQIHAAPVHPRIVSQDRKSTQG